jgi:hypothetical protein
MPWSPLLTQLRDALAKLYPDPPDWRRIAASAELPTSRIVLQGNAVNVWHAILEEADKQGQVEAVIRVGLGEYPNHEVLQAAARAYGVPVETRDPGSQSLSGWRQGGAMDRSALLNILTTRLSAGELQTLCFDLDIDYDDLSGGAKSDKARELIQYLERRGRLPELVPQLRRSRPDIFPQDQPSAPTAPGSGGQAPVADPRDRDATAKTVILFLASDPTNATRLRLGEEQREIQEKLQLAKERDRFDLQTRLSVRPADLVQALLDIRPQVVHFSGHGEEREETRGRGEGETRREGEKGERGVKLVQAKGADVASGADAESAAEGGAIYLEDARGQAQAVLAEALAALFKQFADQVRCVVLNACYSEGQARAIARHIPYVVGMRRAIGDRAAIAFSIGFYQGLGAGRSVEEAYGLGCVVIQLQGIPEHLTPVLIKREEHR